MIVLSNVAVPTDGIRLIQGQVAAYIEGESAGEGELTVSERYQIGMIVLMYCCGNILLARLNCMSCKIFLIFFVG